VAIAALNDTCFYRAEISRLVYWMTSCSIRNERLRDFSP